MSHWHVTPGFHRVFSCISPLQHPTLPLVNLPLSILTSTKQGQVGLATTLHRNLPMAWMRFELMIFVLEARRSNQMSQQAMLQIENAKFQYIENRLSILYFINTNYY